MTTTGPVPTTVPADEEEQPADSTGFPADLTGTYVGSAIYEEENGTPHDRLTYQLELEDDGGTISGVLTHANTMFTDFSVGRGRLPVVVERSGDSISVRWDESVGPRDDTTPMQCDVVEIWFTASVLDDPQGLQIEDGRWDASGDEPSELDEECHNHGVPIVLRGILRVINEPLAGSS